MKEIIICDTSINTTYRVSDNSLVKNGAINPYNIQVHCLFIAEEDGTLYVTKSEPLEYSKGDLVISFTDRGIGKRFEFISKNEFIIETLKKAYETV